MFLKELNKFNQKMVQKVGSKNPKSSMLHLMVIEEGESRPVSRKLSAEVEILHDND